MSIGLSYPVPFPASPMGGAGFFDSLSKNLLCGKIIVSRRSRNPSPGEKVDSKTTGTGGFEDGSGMRETA